LSTYCSEDLGGFYLDILKDRLYTTPAKGLPRRSAQTALALIRDALLKLMAPILSFTAEEAWAIAHPRDATIFVHVWKDAIPAIADPATLIAKWQRVIEVRSEVQKQLEVLRERGAIGSSLQAEATIAASGDHYDALASLGDDLRFVLITSAARVERSDGGSTFSVHAQPLSNAKCQRCWHYRADVGRDAAYPSICGRCVANLHGAGEARRYA
jgi:isoleucyl-tRNA synthetase